MFKAHCKAPTVSVPALNGRAGQFLTTFHLFDCVKQLFIGLQAFMEVRHKGKWTLRLSMRAGASVWMRFVFPVSWAGDWGQP